MNARQREKQRTFFIRYSGPVNLKKTKPSFNIRALDFTKLEKRVTAHLQAKRDNS